MKKILISVLIVLLIVLAYFTIFRGLSFGQFKILSAKEIVQNNDALMQSISQVKLLLEKDYPAKKQELSESIQDLLDKKEQYFEIAKTSTEGEILKANTEDVFYREYLWTKIGRYATKKGVDMNMSEVSSDIGTEDMKNLNFTVTGYYVGILDFISALESDEELGFKIEDFRMTSGETNLTATFVIRNVRIKSENLSSGTVDTSEATETSETSPVDVPATVDEGAGS